MTAGRRDISVNTAGYRCARCKKVIGRKQPHLLYGRTQVVCHGCKLPNRPRVQGDRATIARALDTQR